MAEECETNSLFQQPQMPQEGSEGTLHAGFGSQSRNYVLGLLSPQNMLDGVRLECSRYVCQLRIVLCFQDDFVHATT